MSDRAYLTETMPMAVVWGRDDQVLPARHSSNVAALAPDAAVTVLPDSGHFPHRDHPEEFVRLLDQFVEHDRAVGLQPREVPPDAAQRRGRGSRQPRQRRHCLSRTR